GSAGTGDFFVSEEIGGAGVSAGPEPLPGSTPRAPSPADPGCAAGATAGLASCSDPADPSGARDAEPPGLVGPTGSAIPLLPAPLSSAPEPGARRTRSEPRPEVTRATSSAADGTVR